MEIILIEFCINVCYYCYMLIECAYRHQIFILHAMKVYTYTCTASISIILNCIIINTTPTTNIDREKKNKLYGGVDKA